MGEADVMKTIQLMPGVQAGVDGSAGLYIRGGSPDQNLILLDGTPVYNVDHLFGFFSVFTPEAVKRSLCLKVPFPLASADDFPPLSMYVPTMEICRNTTVRSVSDC